MVASVQSMMGEDMNSAEITDSELPGDRAYVLVDSVDGKVVSAKTQNRPRSSTSASH
jgi:uncharacterized protein YcbX